MNNVVLTPTDFVALANQTLEHVFGFCQIEGEVSGMRVSKGKWVYFSLKDDLAKVECFASIYALPGPIEDGMVVRASGTPRLHPQFGFNVTVQNIVPAGEGTIKKALELLKAKLLKEGLFDESRKKSIPYPPQTIALVTSVESAAYADFIKIIEARWPFVAVVVYDTQVQGDVAPVQLAAAIANANTSGTTADVLVVTRGGGSADDLSAFNDERVVRAIAGSRMPTLVAIGHEIDESLSELVADRRASTPSNAAELLVPDKKAELAISAAQKKHIGQQMVSYISAAKQQLAYNAKALNQAIIETIESKLVDNYKDRQLLEAFNPLAVLRRGYSVVRSDDLVVTTASQLAKGKSIKILFAKGQADATVTDVHDKL